VKSLTETRLPRFGRLAIPHASCLLRRSRQHNSRVPSNVQRNADRGARIRPTAEVRQLRSWRPPLAHVSSPPNCGRNLCAAGGGGYLPEPAHRDRRPWSRNSASRSLSRHSGCSCRQCAAVALQGRLWAHESAPVGGEVDTAVGGGREQRSPLRGSSAPSSLECQMHHLLDSLSRSFPARETPPVCASAWCSTRSLGRP
jgi:hypothetical protein